MVPTGKQGAFHPAPPRSTCRHVRLPNVVNGHRYPFCRGRLGARYPVGPCSVWKRSEEGKEGDRCFRCDTRCIRSCTMAGRHASEIGAWDNGALYAPAQPSPAQHGQLPQQRRIRHRDVRQDALYRPRPIARLQPPTHHRYLFFRFQLGQAGVDRY